MRQVELYINNLTIDYNELKSIPASIRKRTDKFLEIVGADGAEVDNVLKSLVIPDTPGNQSKLQTLMTQGALGRGSTRVSVKMVVNGIMIFAGPGILKKATKRSGAAASHLLELLGDGLSLWERLEGVSLRSLDLGEITWSFANILSNWNDTDFSIFKAWFCPVVYGSERGTGVFDIKDFRPSVGFKPIVDAIFQGQGYTVVSEFFDTYFFRRHAHTFGVGDLWKLHDPDWQTAYIKASFGAQTCWTIGFVSGIYIIYEPDEDPSTMYFENGQPQFEVSPPNFVNQNYVNYIEAQIPGYYKVKVTINSEDDIDQLTLFVFRPGNPTPIFEPTFAVTATAIDSPGVLVEAEFLLEAGDQIHIICLTEVTPSGFEVNIRSVKVHVYMLNKPFIGSDIDVASCLPDEEVKSFLRGISHMFCLAWAIDDVTKRVFCEPRFDYTLIEDGAPVVRKGFYRRDWPLKTFEVDAEEVEVEYVSPFGESLKLSYKEDSNDPMEKATLAALQRSNTKKIPPYYTDIDLHDRGAKAEISQNPYFATLYQSQPSDIELREDAYLPTILPSSYKRGDKLPGIIWTPFGQPQKREEMPTYEGNPKCGIMFPDALSFAFHYDDTETTYFSESARAPWITQHKWIDIGGTPALADWDFAPAYPDLVSKDVGRNTRGLVSTFYPTYISTIKEGQVLSGRINIPLPSVAALNYREMRRMPYDANESVWILLELSGYKPLIGDECDAQLVKYVTARQEDMNAVTYDDPDIDPIVPDIAPENIE